MSQVLDEPDGLEETLPLYPNTDVFDPRRELDQASLALEALHSEPASTEELSILESSFPAMSEQASSSPIPAEPETTANIPESPKAEEEVLEGIDFSPPEPEDFAVKETQASLDSDEELELHDFSLPEPEQDPIKETQVSLDSDEELELHDFSLPEPEQAPVKEIQTSLDSGEELGLHDLSLPDLKENAAAGVATPITAAPAETFEDTIFTLSDDGYTGEEIDFGPSNMLEVDLSGREDQEDTVFDLDAYTSSESDLTGGVEELSADFLDEIPGAGQKEIADLDDEEAELSIDQFLEREGKKAKRGRR